MTRVVFTAHMLLLLALVPNLDAAKITLEKDDQGITVMCDGQPFARYHKKSGAKPILWPLHGPGGQQLTRGYPMRKALATERDDHLHHRSFWFDHGDVNGISFWHESGDNGTIEHREYLKIQEGDQGMIRTSNQWVAPGGEVLCEDIRTMVFAADETARWIDFLVKVTATQDKVVFGDTKEGSFGVRVAGTMRVNQDPGGTIVNSEGQRDGDAWGKRAAWVDYSGPVDGQTVGIAILNHPLSLRYPTYWHVRPYGLFAANPFGLHDFLNTSDAPGALTLDKGESFEMFYRVVLHNGDAEAAQIAERFKRYATESVGQ